MKKTTYAFLFIPLLVSACASGVLPKGNGIYTVSTDYFSAAAAKKAAFSAAIAHCQKEGKQISVIKSEDIPVNKWDLDFMCE